MKKSPFSILLAALSIWLCGFAVPAKSAKADKSLTVTVATTVKSDSSSLLRVELLFSKDLIDMADALNPDFNKDTLCVDFMEDTTLDLTMTQVQRDEGIACVSEEAFEDLKDLQSRTEDLFPGLVFDRLEIKDGKFYYDLKSGADFTYSIPLGMGVTMQGWWTVTVPGELIRSNADQTDGQTLTWNLMKIKPGDRLQAESQASTGLDSTILAIVVVVLLGCCCLVLLIAGVAVFFFLRRKPSAS